MPIERAQGVLITWSFPSCPDVTSAGELTPSTVNSPTLRKETCRSLQHFGDSEIRSGFPYYEHTVDRKLQQQADVPS